MAQNVYMACIRTIDRGTWDKDTAVTKVTNYHRINALTDDELTGLLSYIEEKLGNH